MRRKNLNLHIRKLIRKEVKKLTKISKSVSSNTSNQVEAINLNPSETLVSRVEQYFTPLLNMLFNRRLLSGANPAKITPSSLKLYISSTIAAFNEENILEVRGQEITLSSYAEDRWIYVYLTDSGTYTANKYAPYVGDNVDRIVICKVWIESGATDYDIGLIRDLREVGVGSRNINHILRQLMVHLMHSAPSVVIGDITVAPYEYASGEEPSGGSGLYVKAGTTGDKLFFAKIAPLADTVVELTPPSVSGTTYNYYIVCSAQVDTDDSDDFAWNVKAVLDTEELELYEIPIAKVEGLTVDTEEITASMIKTIGYQRNVYDYYDYPLTFKYTSDAPKQFDLGEIAEHQGIIRRIITYVGQFSADFSGGLPSGETARIQFDLKVNGSIIYTWYIDYDETDEDDLTNDEILSEVIASGESYQIKPGDIVKITMTEDFSSGYTFTKDNISVKILCSKIHHNAG